MATRKTTKPTTKPKRFVAVRGLNPRDGSRYEPGDKVPQSVIDADPWLVERGHVKEVSK